MIRKVTLAMLILTLGLAMTGCSGGSAQPPQNHDVIKTKDGVDKSGKKHNAKSIDASL